MVLWYNYLKINKMSELNKDKMSELNKDKMSELDKDAMFNLVEDLSHRLIDVICNKPDFSEKLKVNKDETLVEMLYLLVKQEKYEQANLVKNEMVIRNLDILTKSKYLEAEEQIINYLNK